VARFLSSREVYNLKIKIYKTIILRLVLYGCETWSLISREECRLKVFENRILRPIFGPKRDVNGEWRRLHTKELHNLYRSPNIVRVIKSRRLRWAGHLARMEDDTNYEVPHCGVFSSPHSHLPWVQVFASGFCFQILSACIPSLT
jgi:hypothetical protein